MRADTDRRALRILGLVAGGVLIAVQAWMFFWTLVNSFRQSIDGPFIGMANWQTLLGDASTRERALGSMRFFLPLLAMVPVSLCASAGILAIRSMRGRVLCWGLFLLPLALGPTELTMAVRWAMGPFFDQGAYQRITMAYATILYDLPFVLLLPILLDALWRPGLLRMWGFLAMSGAFWALFRGFNAPPLIQQAIHAGGLDAAWTQTLSAYERFPSLKMAASNLLNLDITLGLLSQLILAAILLPAALLATRMIGRWRRGAASVRALPLSTGLLALPAAFLALLPLGVYLSHLPKSALMPIQFAQFLPTALNILGSLLAVAAGILLAYPLTLKGRKAARSAVWKCVLCGVFFLYALFIPLRGWLDPTTPAASLAALLSAIPLFGVTLALALGMRLGPRIHRARGLAGVSLLAVGYGLGGSAALERLFFGGRNPSLAHAQMIYRISQNYARDTGLPHFERFTADAPIAPFLTLFVLALMLGGVVLAALAFRRDDRAA